MDGLGGTAVVVVFCFLVYVVYLILSGRSWERWGWFKARPDKERESRVAIAEVIEEAIQLVASHPVRCDKCGVTFGFCDTVVYAKDSAEAYVYAEDPTYLLHVGCFKLGLRDYEAIATLTFIFGGG